MAAEDRVLYLCGSVGSGKSTVIAKKLLSYLEESPEGSVGILCSNTYKQFLASTKKCLEFELRRLGYKNGEDWFYNGHSQSYKFPKHGDIEVFCFTDQARDAIEGVTASFVIADEVQDYDDNTFKKLMDRLRGKGSCQMFLTGYPPESRLTWLYESFYKNPRPGFKRIDITVFENPAYIDMPEYIVDMIKNRGGVLKDGCDLNDYYEAFQINPKEVKNRIIPSQDTVRYIFGEYSADLSGLVYKFFDPDKHIHSLKTFPFEKHTIYLGMDFNGTAKTYGKPYSYIYAQCLEDKLYVYKEVVQRRTNVIEQSLEVTKYLCTGKKVDLDDPTKVERSIRKHSIVSDSTGSYQTTNSNKSCHDILRGRGLCVEYTKNPSRLDRIQVVNNLLVQDRILIDENCGELIDELSSFSVDDFPDEGDLVHISVALGYLCHFLFPESGTTQINRHPKGLKW